MFGGLGMNSLNATSTRGALCAFVAFAPAIAAQGTPGPDVALSLAEARRLAFSHSADLAAAKEIAAALAISSRTVEFHKYRMLDMLGLKNSAELIHFAIKHGIVSG